LISKIYTKVTDVLLSGTVVVTIGILTASFFSYLLQFFLGRTLSVEEYGTFNALLSLMYLVGVPSGVFATAIIKVSSELLAKEQFGKLTSLFRRLILYFVIIGAISSLSIILLRNILSNYLNISQTSLFVAFGLFLGVSYIMVAPNAYLQGLLRFKAYAVQAGFIGFFRFLFPSLFVLLGFGVIGVFAGMGLAVLFVFPLSLLLLKKNFKKVRKLDLSDSLTRILRFSVPVLFINFGMMFLNNVDVIMVKKFFSSTQAGHYAGTVTLGKILLFGASTVTTVTFPQISVLYTKGAGYFEKFKKMFLLQLLLVFCGVLIFTIFPRVLTLLFFGSTFENSIAYLPRFSLFVGAYVLVNFFILFYLAIERVKVVLFLLPATIIQFILLNLSHANLIQIINVNIYVTFALLLSLGAYTVFLRKKELL